MNHAGPENGTAGLLFSSPVFSMSHVYLTSSQDFIRQKLATPANGEATMQLCKALSVAAINDNAVLILIVKFQTYKCNVQVVQQRKRSINGRKTSTAVIKHTISRILVNVQPPRCCSLQFNL